MPVFVQRIITRLHVGLFRAGGGRVGGKLWGLRILLLTTAGRKSGKHRTTPLCYLADSDTFVVVASNGGATRNPAWWINLQHTPEASVETGRSRQRVTARVAAPEERARLWAEITAIAPGYLKYQARTEREIPLVILRKY
jgi:deazaflavin-dependent oxidoreductase (nitroreductase family)